MRTLVLTSLLLSGAALAQAPAPEYVPAPADQIPGYSEKRLPCELVRGEMDSLGGIETDEDEIENDANVATFVVCQGSLDLAKLSLRELSLLRNTIYARYGWAGFRKPWLREHFQKQPWYKPDPKFTARRLSPMDLLNVGLIAKAEMSLRMVDLERRRDTILARVRTPGGKPELDKLTPEDRIELGLLSRAMGEFAVDEGQRNQLATSLDTVLSVKELRQLSLRDLRLLRNTLFARRGRPFKSELLREHFSRMPWYKPDKAYTDERLTKTDKRNIELIRQVEEEFGGALKDKDFQIDNPSQAETRFIEQGMMA